AAANAISIYYNTTFHEILSARIRWATVGVQDGANPAMYSTNSVRNCLFENCVTGVYRTSSGYATIGLTNVKKHNVTTPVAGGGIYGSMTDELFYTDKSFAGLNEFDTGLFPPDTMGAVGTSYFVELLNGLGTSQSIAAYNKTG